LKRKRRIEKGKGRKHIPFLGPEGRKRG